MKWAARLALAIGIVAVVALVAHEGIVPITSLLSQAGPAWLLLVPLHALPLLLDVLGWQTLLPGSRRLPMLFVIASIREAINRLLPVANIGGELAGVRLLIRDGVEGTTAASSVIVEVTLTLISQYLFLVVGVVLLSRLTANVRTLGAFSIVLAAGIPVVTLLPWLLRSGVLFRWLESLTARIVGEGSTTRGDRGWDGLNGAIRDLAGRYGVSLRAIAWQVAGLIAGCAETWLLLRWLGHPSSFAAALALDSSALAARNVIFMVPAGLGVQEAGLIGVGHLLGLGSDVAIALSLAKRAREVLYGVPALVAWYVIEARHGVRNLHGHHEP